METLNITGLLRIYELPGDEEWCEYRRWWPRFSPTEKERKGYLVFEGENLVTSAGRTQLLTFAGSSSGTTPAFAQQYAVGTGAIFTVAASDTTLSTELFRAAPGSFSVVGNGVTITTTFSTSQANGSWTNAGIFGVSATSTANSGTMMTHILCTYGKNNTITAINDYLISLV